MCDSNDMALGYAMGQDSNGEESFARINTGQVQYYLIQGV